MMLYPRVFLCYKGGAIRRDIMGTKTIIVRSRECDDRYNADGYPGLVIRNTFGGKSKFVDVMALIGTEVEAFIGFERVGTTFLVQLTGDSSMLILEEVGGVHKFT